MNKENNPFTRPEVIAKIVSLRYDSEGNSIWHPRLGMHNSDEHNKAISAANSGKITYNNGVYEIYLKSYDDIPDGFVKGALPRLNRRKEKNMKPVRCIETGEVFNNKYDAIKVYPKAGHLIECCLGLREKAGGYH